MSGERFGRGYPPRKSDAQATTAFPAASNAVFPNDLTPMQIQGSQVFRRQGPNSQHDHKMKQPPADNRQGPKNDELERLRADNRRKDEHIAALTSEIQNRNDRSRAREENIRAEFNQKLAAAKQKAKQDRTELRQDLEVSESLQDDQRAKNRVLKAENREQKKALSDYHVLYSLKKAYETQHSKLEWHKRIKAERLYAKYQSADVDAMKAAYELYEFLEKNGLDKTIRLDPDLKKSLKWLVDKNERPSG